MKKIVSILIMVLLIVSCQDNRTFDQKISDSLNGYLKTKSSGDKFILVDSFKVVKEVTVKERKERVNDNTLNAVRSLNITSPSPDLLAQFEKEYEFLQNQKDSSAIALYQVKFSVKKETLKSETIPTNFKALLLNDKNLTVLFVSVDRD